MLYKKHCHVTSHKHEVPVVTANKDNDFWVDACISKIILALNKGGLKTTASCCGHGENGHIILQDGRVLEIHPTLEGWKNTKLKRRETCNPEDSEHDIKNGVNICLDCGEEIL